MSKNKFYAVLNGKEGKPKIYEDWITCQKNTKGIKNNTIFKSFPTKEEALAFLNKNDRKTYRQFRARRSVYRNIFAFANMFLSP